MRFHLLGLSGVLFPCKHECLFIQVSRLVLFLPLLRTSESVQVNTIPVQPGLNSITVHLFGGVLLAWAVLGFLCIHICSWLMKILHYMTNVSLSNVVSMYILLELINIYFNFLLLSNFIVYFGQIRWILGGRSCFKTPFQNTIALADLLFCCSWNQSKCHT